MHKSSCSPNKASKTNYLFVWHSSHSIYLKSIPFQNFPIHTLLVQLVKNSCLFWKKKKNSLLHSRIRMMSTHRCERFAQRTSLLYWTCVHNHFTIASNVTGNFFFANWTRGKYRWDGEEVIERHLQMYSGTVLFKGRIKDITKKININDWRTY